MRITYKILIYSLFMLLMADCVQPYEPEIDKYENALVVDGIFSNLPGPYEVSLSRTFPYDADTCERVTGASVRIIDDLGNEIPLTEVSRGIYRSDSSGPNGQIGRSYKLSILTSDGNQYESDFQLLKSPIPIDSLYYKYEPISKSDVKGVQVYLDTHDPENNTHYYGWEFEETWEFHVPFITSAYPNSQICYRSFNPKRILVGSSIDNNSDEILQHPLFYIDDQSNRLKYKYTAMVRQYTLSETVYHYYKNLAGMNESTGSLFDPAPYTLSGNVKNINNEDEPVLGIFQVSAISSKRIFIKKSELPNEVFPPSGYEYCEMVRLYVQDSINSPIVEYQVDSIIDFVGMVVMDTTMEGPYLVIRFASSKACFDCTLSGSNEPPDFWE